MKATLEALHKAGVNFSVYDKVRIEPTDARWAPVKGGGLQSTEVAFLPLTQRPWVQFSAFPKIYFEVA